MRDGRQRNCFRTMHTGGARCRPNSSSDVHTSSLNSSIRTKSGKKTSNSAVRAPRAGRARAGGAGHPLLPARSQALASIRRRLHSLSNVAAARTLSRRRLAVCSSSGRPAVAPAGCQLRLAPRHAVLLARFGAIASCAQRVPLVGWRSASRVRGGRSLVRGPPLPRTAPCATREPGARRSLACEPLSAEHAAQERQGRDRHRAWYRNTHASKRSCVRAHAPRN